MNSCQRRIQPTDQTTSLYFINFKQPIYLCSTFKRNTLSLFCHIELFNSRFCTPQAPPRGSSKKSRDYHYPPFPLNPSVMEVNGIYDHSMSTRCFSLIINKIFVWASKITRQVTMAKIWICTCSYPMRNECREKDLQITHV
jgi:hypothetical protein